MKQIRKNRFYGTVTGFIGSIFGKRKLRVKNEDLHKMEFSTSTQRTGVRFNEKIRNAFRHKWLKTRDSS